MTQTLATCALTALSLSSSTLGSAPSAYASQGDPANSAPCECLSYVTINANPGWDLSLAYVSTTWCSDYVFVPGTLTTPPSYSGCEPLDLPDSTGCEVIVSGAFTDLDGDDDAFASESIFADCGQGDTDNVVSESGIVAGGAALRCTSCTIIFE